MLTKPRALLLATAALAAVAVYALLNAPAWLWHPLGECTGTVAAVVRCKSYNLWSGIGSDLQEISLPVSIATGAFVAWRFYVAHLTCHVTTCKKPALHPVEGTPYRTCATHHPEVPDGEITAEHIHDHHRRGREKGDV